MTLNRRSFLKLAGAITASTAMSSPMAGESGLKSPFRIAVITDEISQDFNHACYVASHDFGMQWVELRDLWKKNVLNLSSSEIDQANKTLQKYQLRVTDIASPLFKVDWPGAPQSKFSPKRDQFHASFTFDQQPEVIERCIAAAKNFNTDRVRGFDFWRLEDQAPYRAAIDAKLLEAANKLAKEKLIFLLENEMACNTATGAEAAKTLAAVQAPNFMLNWDPGNAAAAGEKAFPDGWNLLPKSRIGHCHCKNVIQKPGGGYEWQPVDKGLVDWVAQFEALKEMGYHHAVSLETHWNGGGSPEESSRQSWAGMKKDLEEAGALS